MAKKAKPKASRSPSNHKRAVLPAKAPASSQRTYTILDYRLEKPRFALSQVRDVDAVRYEVSGTLDAPELRIADVCLGRAEDHTIERIEPLGPKRCRETVA